MSKRLKKLLKTPAHNSNGHAKVKGTTLETLSKNLGVSYYKARTVMKYDKKFYEGVNWV